GQYMNKEFVKITTFYTIGIIVVFYMIWAMLDIVLPEANLNLLRALSTAFGVNLPDDILVNTEMGMRAVMVTAVIALLSILLIILNVVFGAVITTHLIRPRVNIILSRKGVLSHKWNTDMPYALVRMCNFHSGDLANIRLTVALTVHERRIVDGKEDEYMTFLPIEQFTPPNILIMLKKTPWSIAIPADAFLSNSMTKDYHFKPGQEITKSFSTGKKFIRCDRKLEILIQGMDTRSYSRFIIHHKIPVDTQDGENYTLHLHRGTFKSLPMNIDDPNELEQYRD
ncbi:MAG: hypothetical protein OXT65_04145, partial [Alphaproteobacteria bacterium]|nr:hypothetical protein [Alphaproteobacteria bacterium]